MKNKIIAFGFVSVFLMSSCGFSSGIDGNGNLKEVSKEVKEFSKIKISGNFNVFLEKSTKKEIVFEMDENLIENTVIKNSSKEISISEKENVADFERYNIYLYTDDLTTIELSGNVKLECINDMDVSEVEIDNNGNSSLKFQGDVKEMDIEISGNSTIELKGEAYQLAAELSGNSGISALDFPTKLINIDLSGNANAQVIATSELDATASGNAVLKYKGQPEKSIEVSGNAEINRID